MERPLVVLKLCGRNNVAGCFGAEGDEGRCRCRRELFVAVVRERWSEPPFVSGSRPPRWFSCVQVPSDVLRAAGADVVWVSCD
ncbi:unnamed protein product [Citrullus colocynthis]|uniref:Phosphoribosylanthranilate isomerase n=1 Tax=Citrullus colocynthis TaxID=252529 RepID=A0ABP0YZG2_9ROSI